MNTTVRRSVIRCARSIIAAQAGLRRGILYRGRLNTIDANRATRRLDNIDPKTNQRVPAPDPNATSVIPTRAPKTGLINRATAGLENGKTMTVGDDKATKTF